MVWHADFACCVIFTKLITTSVYICLFVSISLHVVIVCQWDVQCGCVFVRGIINEVHADISTNYVIIGSYVRPAMVGSWWSWRLGYLTTWGRLHIWARHFWKLQSYQWFDTDQQSSPIGDGGEFVIKHLGLMLWIVLSVYTCTSMVCMIMLLNQIHLLCIAVCVCCWTCLWLCFSLRWMFNWQYLHGRYMQFGNLVIHLIK